MAKQKKQLREGRIKFAEFVIKFAQNYFFEAGAGLNNGFPLRVEDVEKELLQTFPEFANKEECPNCGASMQEYVYHFDILCGLLLLAMGKEVVHRLNKGLQFTEANQVHVPSLPVSLAVQCRTTISSKLGLIAKVKTARGTQARGVWCITERGYAALKGDPVPAMVKVWRGKIEERFENVITLAGAFQVHREGIEKAIAQNRKPKHDYRTDFADYNAGVWYEVGGNAVGRLL